MATANGEGLTWSSVKTLLTSSYPSFNKNEIITDLTTLIIGRETHILTHEDDHEAFYSLFVALATNALCSVSGCLSSSTLPQVSSACNVLLKFLLNRLDTPNRACAVTPKYMMILINSLCQGGQCLGKSDVVTFTCLFKPTELPPDPDVKEQESSSKEKVKSSRLSRLDTQKDLFDQMTSVFAQAPSIDIKILPRADSAIDDSFDIQPKTPVSISGGGAAGQDTAEDSCLLFTQKNAEMLLSMNGAEILLRACSQLTFLSKYMERFRDAIAGSTFLLPATLSQALTLRNGYQFLLTEVSDVWQAFSLPIIEPLTPDRLRTIVEVAMGCLFAAVSVATADTVVNVVKPSGPTQAPGAKDEELDNQGHCIVQKSLEIFSWVASAVKVSTRAGGNVAQNFNLFAAWVMLNGLQGILALTPAMILERKEASKSKMAESVTKREGQTAPPRPLSAKGNQPFLSVTAVALANNALQLMTPLLEDLSVETGNCDAASLRGKTSEGLKLDIMDSLTAWNRVQALLSSVAFHDLMFNLVSVSFRKAVYLTRLKQGSDSQETTSSSSTSDSNTYFEDDFSTSEENSEADDDYEPILGHWLEEAMSPSDASSSPPSVSLQIRAERGRSENKRQRESSPGDGNPPFVPDKWEPEGFTLLVKSLLNFFNTHLLNSGNQIVKQVARSSITKDHLAVVAQLTKDLDKECARNDSVDRGYASLSHELARFNHTLVASGCLTEELENFFLASLNVSPTEPDPWPLTAHTRTLAVLVSILLRRQQMERCDQSTVTETVHNSLRAVWTKFLDRLHGAITWFENKTEAVEDVNVEHLQVLLLLFHSLRLSQKKEILVSLCNIIIQVSQMEPSRMQKTIPLPVSRLVLLMEYMMHYFYDPPTQLTDQVQHNLFTSQMVPADKDRQSKAIKFFVCREVEDNFRKGLLDTPLSEVASMRPRFYNLCPAEPSAMDVSKVDGLAVSCILSPESKLNYSQFYDACINLLMAGSLCDKTKEKFSHLDACSMHYHFLLLWRLLSCLPPSSEYLYMLKEMSGMGKAHILHTLRWAPRLGHKSFCAWIADCLAKQGLNYTTALELVETTANTSNTCRFDVNLAMSYIKEQVSKLPVVYSNQLGPKELPGISDILVLDAVMAKCQVCLDQLYTRSMIDPDPNKAMKFSGELIPVVFILIEAYSAFARSCILNKVCSPEDKSLTLHRLRAFGQVLSVGSNHSSAVRGLGSGVVGLLPSTVRGAIDKWNSSGGNEFPSMGAWRNAFASDLIPSESYMDAIHSAHMVTLSGQPAFCINASLRHVLQSLVRFGSDLVVWCPNMQGNTILTRVMFPLIYDVTTEYLGEMVLFLKSKFLGPSEEARFEERAYKHGIQACDQIIVEFSDAESGLDEKILYECIKFMETCLEKPVARKAFKTVYTENADMMTSLLLTVARSNLSDTYTTHILRLFNKLFQQVEREPVDENLSALCQGLTELASVEKGEVQKLLIKIIRGSENVSDEAVVKTNNSLLQSLIKHIVKEKSPIGETGVYQILQALIPMGAVLLTSSTPTDLRSFPDLMAVLPMLAGMGSGYGHVLLFEAAMQWLQICMSSMCTREDLDESRTQRKPSLEILTCLLSYVGEALGALKKGTEGVRPFSPILEVEPMSAHDCDGEWFEELGQEDEESGGEDSDEEALNNKLCTFTITQKEFMNQHWYHCHTCKMVDGVGVCSICAKVCHKDHDLTYAKFGSFFCDCGVKQDASCKALVKRTSQSGSDMVVSSQSQSPFASDSIHHPHSSLRRRLSSTPEADGHKAIAEGSSLEHISKVRESLAKQLENFRDKLLGFVGSTETVNSVLTILDSLMPTLKDSYQEVSPKGSSFRAHQALRDLHSKAKEVETTTDQLMTVTLGSQEGAFENVRMNYSGDQGQTIRQLLTAHMLRRVAMCVLSSPHGKRQHLAVSHEKGKMTILQLSALLKQADSSKKKLTLTRLSSAPVPFTVLSISGNPCNEDYLAVSGLKDCHVMTFTSSGTVADHLVLHPSLTPGNFIIKAVWLPGSQTELAIITADFVKIYDLGVDALSPQYYFLLPTGKIRDVTFVCNEESQAMVLMASSGYIYTQTLEDSSSARHGPFYITNVLEIKHSDLKDVNGQVAGGGVSVYYSHALQLLFFSYSQGKSFTAPIARDLSTVTNLFPITFKSSNGGSSGGNANSTSSGGGSANNSSGSNNQGGGGGKNSGAQPLVSWSEVPGHTGLMYCMAQATNNPIILMIKPDKITLQEIKVMPSKAKIQDVVAIRHPASNSDQHRTTMILLCEDGSLRIYMANVEATNFWMSPYLQPQSPISVLKPTRKKKSAKAGRPTNSVLFPVDFFEHCQHTNDVEFGGNDLLEIYNVQQVKSRLNTTGQYIASTKTPGFTLEVTNSNSSTLIAGIRLLVGSQSVERAPSYVEINGRTIPLQLTLRARWFDIPFTREESIDADKKLFITFGSSVDPASITMVDSIKVYVKTKELLGWPEEPEDFQDQMPSSAAKMNNAISSTVTAPEVEAATALPVPITLSDRLLGCALEVLDGVFSSLPESEESARRSRALSQATVLLNLNSPDLVQLHTKSLLASMFPSKSAYHNHKDQAQLKHVMTCLTLPEGAELDVEAFQRLLVTARSVSVSRPMNLVKFAQTHDAGQMLEVSDIENECTTEAKEPSKALPTAYSLTEAERASFTSRLVDAFWKLHASRPANPMLAPVCLPGLTNVEVTVCALVEVIHAFTMCDPDCLQLATKHYMRLLLSKDLAVSFACRQALIRVLRPRQRRRRVFIPSPPHCTLQGASDIQFDDNSDEKEDKPAAPSVFLPPASAEADQDQSEQDGHVLYEVVDNNLLMGGGGGGARGNDMQALERLWRMEESYPPMVEIPPDADDETMVELAIALSLQEQGNGQGSLPPGLPQQLANNLGINIGQAANALGLQNLGAQGQASMPDDDEVEIVEASELDRLDIAMVQGAGGISLQDLGLGSVAPQDDDLDIEERPLSDTTASAPASDDEIGSTAATDGSTLRTSPAEHGGGSGGGSESGGSAVDSISATSGRSSSYGFHALEGLPAGQREEQAGFEASSAFFASGTETFEQDTGTTQSRNQDLSELVSSALATIHEIFPTANNETSTISPARKMGDGSLSSSGYPPLRCDSERLQVDIRSKEGAIKDSSDEFCSSSGNVSQRQRTLSDEYGQGLAIGGVLMAQEMSPESEDDGEQALGSTCGAARTTPIDISSHVFREKSEEESRACENDDLFLNCVRFGMRSRTRSPNENVTFGSSSGMGNCGEDDGTERHSRLRSQDATAKRSVTERLLTPPTDQGLKYDLYHQISNRDRRGHKTFRPAEPPREKMGARLSVTGNGILEQSGICRAKLPQEKKSCKKSRASAVPPLREERKGKTSGELAVESCSQSHATSKSLRIDRTPGAHQTERRSCLIRGATTSGNNHSHAMNGTYGMARVNDRAITGVSERSKDKTPRTTPPGDQKLQDLSRTSKQSRVMPNERERSKNPRTMSNTTERARASKSAPPSDSDHLYAMARFLPATNEKEWSKPQRTTPSAGKKTSTPRTTQSAGKKSATPRTTPSAGEKSTIPRTTQSAGKKSAPPRSTPSAGKKSATLKTTPSAGNKLTTPRTTPTIGETSTMPRTIPTTGETSTMPRTTPTTGETSTMPRTIPTIGETSTMPRTIPTIGETSTMPRTTPTTGETSTMPRTIPTTGETSTMPRTTPTIGETSTMPRTTPTTGETSTMPRTTPTTGETSTMPRTIPTIGGTSTMPRTTPTIGETSTMPRTTPTTGETSTMPRTTPTIGETSTMPRTMASSENDQFQAAVRRFRNATTGETSTMPRTMASSENDQFQAAVRRFRNATTGETSTMPRTMASSENDQIQAAVRRFRNETTGETSTMPRTMASSENDQFQAAVRRFRNATTGETSTMPRTMASSENDQFQAAVRRFRNETTGETSTMPRTMASSENDQYQAAVRRFRNETSGEMSTMPRTMASSENDQFQAAVRRFRNETTGETSTMPRTMASSENDQYQAAVRRFRNETSGETSTMPRTMASSENDQIQAAVRRFRNAITGETSTMPRTMASSENDQFQAAVRRFRNETTGETSTMPRTMASSENDQFQAAVRRIRNAITSDERRHGTENPRTPSAILPGEERRLADPNRPASRTIHYVPVIDLTEDGQDSSGGEEWHDLIHCRNTGVCGWLHEGLYAEVAKNPDRRRCAPKTILTDASVRADGDEGTSHSETQRQQHDNVDEDNGMKLVEVVVVDIKDSKRNDSGGGKIPDRRENKVLDLKHVTQRNKRNEDFLSRHSPQRQRSDTPSCEREISSEFLSPTHSNFSRNITYIKPPRHFRWSADSPGLEILSLGHNCHETPNTGPRRYSLSRPVLAASTSHDGQDTNQTVRGLDQPESERLLHSLLSDMRLLDEEADERRLSCRQQQQQRQLFDAIIESKRNSFPSSSARERLSTSESSNTASGTANFKLNPSSCDGSTDSEDDSWWSRWFRNLRASGQSPSSVVSTLSCSCRCQSCLLSTQQSARLHELRRRFLESLLAYFPEVQNVGGVNSIPFMQVLLMLTSDLDSEEEKDRGVLDLVLTTILQELDLSGKDLENIVQRSEAFEVKLILLRLLSVLLSRSKSGSKHHGESAFVSNSTASALLSSGTIPYCLKVLQSVLPFWKNYSDTEDEKVNVPGQLLKPHPAHTPPDMSPFFLRQYVKNHASDIFEEYPQLLTEMVLRLPYQLKKIADEQKLPNGVFDKKWHDILSEYMLTQQSPFVKRQVRKLLLFLCGSKEKYRQLRDDHTVQSHLHQLQEMCTKWGLEAGPDMPSHSIILPYDTLLSMIEHLKAVCDIAVQRPCNWQLYCQLKTDTLPYLIQASILLDEGVAPTLLQLLQYAICGVKPSAQGHGNSGSGSSSTSPVKQKGKKDRDKGSKGEEPEESRPFDESLCQDLVKQLNTTLSTSLLIKFVRTYLLDSNSSGNRWMAHALVLQIYRNSSNVEQQTLLDSLWGLWQELPVFGRKAAQFVDLLGYFVLKTPGLVEKKVQEYLQKTVALLKRENQVLAHHPNATIYNMLQGLVDFDGYYLESDPCLVCNNPEVPFQTLKLSAVKVDSKFTTTTQIVKLVGSHTIAKISLRISDLKRTKMVQTLNIYYNNRSVQAVVELKNRPGLWHKARKVKLTSGQTEVKVEFPIPIVACNLMIEYADFYDNLQATAETLQCPRCSASVPASPGVCGNCGENVYQCHKCRSINYDEKDPFLCNSCGFCKYAKFDYTLMGKPCCAVDPIENEEDRKKAITSINNLLDKADRIYRQLQLHRPDLESLLIQVTEHGSERIPSGSSKDGGGAAGAVPVSSVNKAIQLLAQKYCGECKAAFDELSKLIQKVMACRRELVEYDQQQRAVVAARGQGLPPTSSTSKVTPVDVRGEKAIQAKGKKDSLRSGKCYGCASAAVEHCIKLLRALVTNSDMRQMLCNEGMIRQLIDYNLRHGALSVRAEIRNLLCLLTRDNWKGADEMNTLIMARITAAVKGHQSNPDLGSSVRHEIMLLATSLLQDDSCWEQRIRCVMRLFLMGMQMRSPVIMESITLPCLRILQGLIKQDGTTKECENADPDSQPATYHMDIKKWLSGDMSYSYQNWKKRLPKQALTAGSDTNVVEKKQQSITQPPQQQLIASKLAREAHEARLMEKYAARWKKAMWKIPSVVMKLTQTTWLQQAIFTPSSRSARQTACSVVEVISQVFSRRKEVIDMLTGCLPDVGQSGECATEFLALYKSLISQDRWKFYLAIKGVMLTLGRLIMKEVEHLQYLEETTLSSDLAQGFALKKLTELLALFVEQEQLKQHYKNRLVGCVLNCYLSLRKLVVQRTKLIDDTQEGLLQMLEELTTGTTSETKEFMAVCVQTVKNYPLDDYRSPIFIFERLCSIIYPEENDITEFFLILEKDPQQEDFLQGRMLGNPYSCLEHGMGPLMRDIKNKICTDCELVALLEDDTGMELLVNKKIISLDLPVKDVYKKIWLPEHGEVESMPVVYRMRGLLGDATEDMVNSLDSGTEENEDKEEVYKMASVLSDCGGLQVMLERLASIKDLVLGKQLMVVLLKLFSYAVHVKANRQRLTNPDLGCINIMLGALNLALWSEQEGVCTNKGQTITEQVLHIMEVVLLEASQQAPEVYTEFSKKCGDKEQLMVMLNRINSPIVRFNPGVLEGLMRLVPFLAFGEEDKMEALLSHFKPYVNFEKFDEDHNQDEEIHLNCFCSIASAIESNANGIRLKDLILRHGMVQTVINYILNHAPEIKTMLATDSAVWKGFLSKASQSFALRILTGLCTKHVPTQNLIAEKCIPILHKLEQVSSNQHLGTLAENLLNALKTNPEAAKKIEEVRQETKAEKKRLAMAVRKKQLGALGMTTNERGQVTVQSSVLKQMEDLKEEMGLTCCICREGYRYQPQKVLAVYTYSRRCNMDDYESKARKTLGYYTVTHFNVIHVDCHTAAVKHARVREEWESAALQNANTRCNGLLPIWGPQVQESVFASCLARHNNYLQECTGIRDLSYSYNIHDLKLLFTRFATERSFSEESGGGGPQSNLYFVPFVMHMVLYAINTTRAASREEKNLTGFLDMPASKWVDNAGEVEGVLYFIILAMHLMNPARWKECRHKFLQRVLVTSHVRAVCPLDAQQSMPALQDKTIQPYSAYKTMLVYFGMVCAVYDKIFMKVKMTEGVPWSKSLFEHIRHNDKTMLDQCDAVLRMYQEEFLPCESLSEFVDVVGMLEEVPDPDKFLTDSLASLS